MIISTCISSNLSSCYRNDLRGTNAKGWYINFLFSST